MIRRLVLGAWCWPWRIAAPVSAQLFGVVFDPTNYANARPALRATAAAARAARHDLPADSDAVPAAAAAVAAPPGEHDGPVPQSGQSLAAVHGARPRTARRRRWILTANTGQGAAAAYARATQPLLAYAGALSRLSAEEAARVRTRYDRLQLADGSVTHGLEALGYLRGHQASMETTVRNLEDDTYANDAGRNTQIAVLNKINATAVTSARLAKDANNVLVSLLEQQLLDATDRREAAAQGINAHIAFLTEAGPLLARTTAQTTTALTTFRIP